MKRANNSLDVGSTRVGNAALLAVLVSLASACASSTNAPAPSKVAHGDAAASEAVVRDAAPEVEVNWGAPNARCCVLPTDAGVNLSDECTLIAHGGADPDAAAIGHVEPCLGGDGPDAASYGQWTCGAEGGAACNDNGLSCDMGSACQLEDVGNTNGGCWGTVQPCFYPWASADH